jgi:cell division protein FtsN
VPRDYKNRPRPRAKQGAPGWAWLLVGLAIGLFVAFLIYLRGHQGKEGLTAVASPSVERQAPTPKAEPEDKKSAPKPRFEFYTILPEMEVPVATKPLPRRGDKEGKHAEEATGRYLLQVASFKSHQEADRLKASLALLGMEARIQTVSIDGEQTWHRVRLGPFSSLAEANEVRRRLNANDLDAVILKVKT